MGKCLQLVAVILTLGARTVGAFSSGPTINTCLTNFPKHNAQKQIGEAPYLLTFSSATYRPRQIISLRLSVNETGGTFAGFQVVAHRVSTSGNVEDLIGSFHIADNSSTTIACFGEVQNLLGHKNASPKSEVNATWTAPDVNVGDIQFLVTVVENMSTFWHHIPFFLQAESAVDVAAPQRRVPPLNISSVLAPDWSACNKTKGCWFVPQSGSTSCSGTTDCLGMLSYRKVNNQFLIEMAIKGQDLYIAVGFSDDKLMGDEPIVSCIARTGHESIQQGFNQEKDVGRQYTTAVSHLVAGYVDGFSYCTFTSQAVLSGYAKTAIRHFNLNNKHYLFLAWGDVYAALSSTDRYVGQAPCGTFLWTSFSDWKFLKDVMWRHGTDVIAKHKQLPAITKEKVNMTWLPSQTSTASCPAIHGTFFISAFLLLFY